MTNPMHSKATGEWGSPGWLVNAAEQIVGPIMTDPCTAPHFPQFARLKNYTAQDDGLKQEWIGPVFCNPPGGLVKEFWRKAIAYESGPVFWVGYSLGQLQTLQSEKANPMMYPICILRKRIAFRGADGVVGKSPTHGNYVCLVTKTDNFVDNGRFWEAMDQHGAVKI